MKRYYRILFAAIAIFCSIHFVYGQRKKADTTITDTTKAKTVPTQAPQGPSKPGPKPYKEVINERAQSHAGLFTVHKVEDKYYFEIPDSLLGRQFMAVTRFSKIAGGVGVYAGELANEQVLKWEKGPADNVFLRVVTAISVADSTNQLYTAVENSNVNPIVAAFDIKAIGPDSTSVVIDVSDFFKGDNLAVSLPFPLKMKLRLQSLAADRSYIEHIHTFPLNTEISTVKTFNAGGPRNPQQAPVPAVDDAGAMTLSIHTSFILLPKTPMAQRLYDPRVGFFADDYTYYGDDQQKVEDRAFILRWRLEPKPEDKDKWLRGELVEPAKPIVYYIDPATPKQWRPYLIAGVNDWQKAFEQAGFKNAIIAKEWPEHDTTMSLEDARYSVIRYFASDIENAYGPNVHDPRSGEILESHIGWYHNVMQLLHDWYQVQAGAVDPKARVPKLDDTLMGQLIRFVSSHEVGHTLGLRHNFGSSSTVPVEMLRNKAWLDQHGHTPSIMDYARFNYIAQPEDNIPEYDLFPRIGEYDRWAIEWGYKGSGAADSKEDQKIVNRWIIDSLKTNPRLWFGTESNPVDPRSQNEDLGNDAVAASTYGIKNLQRIVPQLPEWTMETADTYENLKNMYLQARGQFGRYMGHVLKNIGGIYETPKSVEEAGPVYTSTPKAMQQQALAFLEKQLFQTPYWLLDSAILNKISDPVGPEGLENMQAGVLNSIMSPSRLNRMLAAEDRFGTAQTYPVEDLLNDLQKGLFSELATGKAPDRYRRNLQKDYVEDLIGLLNSPQVGISMPPEVVGVLPATKNTDLPSMARAQLATLKKLVDAAIAVAPDKLTRYHLQDISERMRRGLDPR